MRLPLYHRPSAFLFLDDEIPYLEMLAFVLPERWAIQLHSRVGDYLSYVLECAGRWEEDAQRHAHMLGQWHRGHSLPALILEYWRSNPGRYRLPNIAVVDYAMPASNGLDVFTNSPNWPTWRILLTGRADEHTAVKAFNDGLIHRFVTKQAPDLAVTMTELLQQLHDAPLPHHEAIWESALTVQQKTALGHAKSQATLSEWLKSRACIEYLVLPHPFGVLALDAQGFAHWLQLELRQDLAVAAELARSAGCDAIAAQAVADGKHLCDVELRLALALDGAGRTAEVIDTAHKGELVAASFDFVEIGQVTVSHAEHLANLPPREIDLGQAPD